MEKPGGAPVDEVKTVAEWMTERGLSLVELVERSGLEKRVVMAMVEARYTPSPQQRRRLAATLGVEAEQVWWGHRTAVDHIHGHGPQFGRSP